MLDGARACWLGARCTEKSGDWWLLRYGRLDTNFAAGRRSYVANLVQFSSESALLLLRVQVMASTSEPSVTNSEATAIPSTLVPGTSVVATVLGTSMAGTQGGDGATTTSAVAASTSAVTVADGTY